MTSVVAEFDVKKDERNRVTLKGLAFEYYHAQVFDDGHIEFYPRILADAALSLRTLSMMDSAMANLEKGKAGGVMNPGDLLGVSGDEDE